MSKPRRNHWSSEGTKEISQPCRGWLISGCRSATRFALAALVLFLAVGARAETTNALSDAEIQGRQLAQQLCAARPAENLTNTGVLQIRDLKGNRTNIPFNFQILATSSNWLSIYDAMPSSNALKIIELVVTHESNSNRYELNWHVCMMVPPKIPPSIGPTTSFMSSDFWIGDLGLEFFHWPAQKVLPKTTDLKRGRSYTLLESTNPNPPTNGYSRVLTWIDKETGGILEAEAYDFNGKLLKDFLPGRMKKVNGQWQLQSMEMNNVQTGSRTRLEFNLTTNSATGATGSGGQQFCGRSAAVSSPTSRSGFGMMGASEAF